MNIRLADMDEFGIIEELYARARRFMAEHGNPNQWGDKYPERQMIWEDMKAGRCFVCTADDKEQPVTLNKGIVGVFCYFEGPDSDYTVIDGAWKDTSPYGVIHRITSLAGTKGVATFCLDWCQKKIPHIRMDTHCDNIPMQHFLRKQGFEYCGIVHVKDGERLAFELLEGVRQHNASDGV